MSPGYSFFIFALPHQSTVLFISSTNTEASEANAHIVVSQGWGLGSGSSRVSQMNFSFGFKSPKAKKGLQMFIHQSILQAPHLTEDAVPAS